MKFFAIIIGILLTGCGYKPLAQYAKETFGGSVYVEVVISPDFPKAGVSIKDMLNRAVLTRLHLPLTSKEEANSILNVNVSNVGFEMISEDSQGFANHYRANVSVIFSYQAMNAQNYEVYTSGSSEYAATNTMTSLSIQKAQLKAIDLALQQAIDQFISKIFYQSISNQKASKNNESKKLSR